MILKTTIDQVYETARVEEVIGDFVSLKKSGTNFKGLSPFSQERTPSFMVSPVKQIWKDFSSGKGGNVIAFLMEHERFSYPEAIRYLAKKYNIEIEETERTDAEKQKVEERESMSLVVEYAKEYFQKTLWETKEGKAIGLTYFEERGFTDETIRKFNLGYSPQEKDIFSKTAQKEKFQLEFLERTGLTIVNENSQIDRFRGRVIFPIKDRVGRVIGFGGRILGNIKKTAKYLNSPESEIYNKSKALYGIYQAKKSIAKKDCCYLVEGYTDVIQMAQSGIENVVSSSGTALTEPQIRLIQALTQNIVVLFDGDAAGLRAALRGVDMILAQGMNVKVCTFPEGEDPDSFARSHSQSEIESFLEENAKDFIQFKASLLLETAVDDPFKKAQTVKDIIESISKIPDPIRQEIYVQSCAKLMNVSEDSLFSALAQQVKKDRVDLQKTTIKKKTFEVVKNNLPQDVETDYTFVLEQQIISLLILYGDREEIFEEVVLDFAEGGEVLENTRNIKVKVFEKIFLDLQQDEVEFASPNFKGLYDLLIQQFQAEGKLTIDKIIPKLDSELSALVSDILMTSEKYLLHEWERVKIYPTPLEKKVVATLTDTILNLRRHLIIKKIEELEDQFVDKERHHAEVLEDLKNYYDLRSIISRKLNRVI